MMDFEELQAGHTAEVLLKDKSKLSGYVHTVDLDAGILFLRDIPDPDSQTSGTSTKCIMFHAVKSFEVGPLVDLEADEWTLAEVDVDPHSANNKNRRERLMKLLTERRIPYTENDGELCVLNTLMMKPPYILSSCECSNEIMLSRVRVLLEEIGGA